MAWSLTTFQHEMRKFDPLLRIRRSQVDPAWWLIERKCARESPCRRKPLDRRGIDAWICDRDGYTEVSRVPFDMLNNHVLTELRAWDMWQFKNAGAFADMIEAEERAADVRLSAEQSSVLQACGEEAYDRAMVRQGDIVSGFHSNVGGWQP